MFFSNKTFDHGGDLWNTNGGHFTKITGLAELVDKGTLLNRKGRSCRLRLQLLQRQQLGS